MILTKFVPLCLLAGLLTLLIPQFSISQTTEEEMSNKLQPGSVAPEFTLPDQTGREISLKDMRGKPVVLYFYPEDFTPGCTKEACDFRDNYAPLAEAGAVVLGVSPDSPESHTNFIAEHKLPFSLLADTSRTVMEEYGAWGEKNMYGKVSIGVIRSTVLIDQEGKVVKVWPRVSVEGHVEAVLNEVKKLKK